MSKKCRECGSIEFKMTRYYFNECIVDADGCDISVGGLKGSPEMDSEIVCIKCSKILV